MTKARQQYSKEQKELLRTGLQRFYQFAQKDKADDYSWIMIAADIEGTRTRLGKAYLNIDGEALRRHAEGQPKGVSFPTSRRNEFWEAIEDYLVDPENPYSSTTKLHVEAKRPDIMAGLCLFEYFYKSVDEKPFLSSVNLCGEFAATYEDASGKGICCLSFGETSEQGVLSVGLKCTSSMSEQRFSGWAVITPEDNLICLAKDIVTGENRIYLTLAVDPGIYEGENPEHVILLDYQHPIELSTIFRIDDYFEYFMSELKSAGNNILIFNRNVNFSCNDSDGGATNVD
ncbi:MAG: hypothetical protein HPY30_00905 [Gammaproteobacteria bacterium (ex Lamellibrachia satsuma)]|nr:MAG: hypothetical protein HPY30_00905 [Gammaproteobacteria bacterium (ex Lamellibrachia satsuma)]